MGSSPHWWQACWDIRGRTHSLRQGRQGLSRSNAMGKGRAMLPTSHAKPSRSIRASPCHQHRAP